MALATTSDVRTRAAMTVCTDAALVRNVFVVSRCKDALQSYVLESLKYSSQRRSIVVTVLCSIVLQDKSFPCESAGSKKMVSVDNALSCVAGFLGEDEGLYCSCFDSC